MLAENFLRFPVSSLHMVMRCFFWVVYVAGGKT